MSFAQSMGEAKACINAVDKSPMQGTSNILNGSSGPGGAAAGTKPAGQTMSQVRTTLKTKTDSLRRQG